MAALGQSIHCLPDPVEFFVQFPVRLSKAQPESHCVRRSSHITLCVHAWKIAAVSFFCYQFSFTRNWVNEMRRERTTTVISASVHPVCASWLINAGIVPCISLLYWRRHCMRAAKKWAAPPAGIKSRKRENRQKCPARHLWTLWFHTQILENNCLLIMRRGLRILSTKQPLFTIYLSNLTIRQSVFVRAFEALKDPQILFGMGNYALWNIKIFIFDMYHAWFVYQWKNIYISYYFNYLFLCWLLHDKNLETVMPRRRIKSLASKIS